jgi:hypothetical protein
LRKARKGDGQFCYPVAEIGLSLTEQVQHVLLRGDNNLREHRHQVIADGALTYKQPLGVRKADHHQAAQSPPPAHAW